MSSKDLERRLQKLIWPEPGAALRLRVRTLSVSPGTTATWVDRVWFSRAWRLSALSMVAALVALEAWSMQSGFVGPGEARYAESSSVRALNDTERDLGVPDGAFAALVRRELTSSAWPPGERFREWSRLGLLGDGGER